MTLPPEQPIRGYMKMISMRKGDLSGYWFDAYGWIACYFAQLEGLSYALIELLGTDDDRAKMASMKYQYRTERAKNLICGHMREQGEAELDEKWDKFLTEAKDTGPMRNMILHNPLSVNLALGDPLNDKDAGIILIHKPDRPMLRLGAVQAFAKSLHELNMRMQELMTQSKLNTEDGH